MKKVILLFLFCSIVSTISAIAGLSVHGSIIDEFDKKPLVNATVKLMKVADSSFVKGVVADQNGTFKIELPQNKDKYYLAVSYAGYQTTNTQPFSSENQKSDVQIGTVVLTSQAASGEVVISADKQQVEYSAGKKVFNVDQAITSQGGNAIDVLRTVPSVSVDVDGNVSLRGNGNVTIMIDNKPANMMGNINQILQNLPSSIIEKVEVITNPGAKYDAEGQTGIINIVLKKQKQSGFNGMVNLTTGNYDTYYLSSNFNYKVDNINFFVNADGGTSRHIRKLNTDSRFFTGDLTTSTVNKAGSQYWRNESGGGKLGAEITLDDRNNLTISADYRMSDGMSAAPNFNKVNLMTPEGTTPSYFYANVYGNGPFDYGNLGLNYIHNFGEKGFDLTFDAYYFPSSFDVLTNFENTPTDALGTAIAGAQQNKYRTQTKGSSDSYQLQSDLVMPLSETSKFEAGVKAYLEGINSTFDYNRYDFASQNFFRDTVQSSRAGHQDNILAAYMNYADRLFDIDYQVGVRTEYTSNELYNFYQNGNDSANFKRSFINFFPNLSLSYNMDETNSVQLSYSRRINRPNGQLLNPYLDKSDSLYWKSGNAALRPEYTNSFEVGYLTNNNIGLFNFEGFYRHTDQVMNPRFRENVTPSVILEKPYNIGFSQSLGVTVSGNFDILKEWKLNTEFSAFNQKTTGNFNSVSYLQESFGWNAKIISNVFLPYDLMVQLYFDYTSPVVITQGKRFEFTLANLAVRKEFFDKKFSLSLNWVDFLNTAKFGGNVSGVNFATDLYNRRDFTYISLTMSYKINDVKRQRPRKGPDGGGGGGGEGNI